MAASRTTQRPQIPSRSAGRLVYGFLSNHARCEPHIVAVGLFNDAAPVGWPLAGCVVPRSGRFELIWPMQKSAVHLLAVSIPLGSNPNTIWLPNSNEILVSSRVLRNAPPQTTEPLCVDLAFRPLDDTDPPIITALPVLLGLSWRPASQEDEGGARQSG